METRIGWVSIFPLLRMREAAMKPRHWHLFFGIALGAVVGIFATLQVMSPVAEAKKAVEEVVDMVDVSGEIMAREVGRIGTGMEAAGDAIRDVAPDFQMTPADGDETVKTVVVGVVDGLVDIVRGREGECPVCECEL